MEYIKGETIYAIMHKQCDIFEEEELINFFTQMSLGVYELHSRNFIHRDIKHDNFMFDQNNNRMVLIDLGGAEVLRDSLSYASQGS